MLVVVLILLLVVTITVFGQGCFVKPAGPAPTPVEVSRPTAELTLPSPNGAPTVQD